MANRYYKKSDIVSNKYYKIPRYIIANFSDIKGRELVIKEGDRLDIICQRTYGDPSHWRAVALYNDIGYFFDLTPGQIIKMPYNIQEVLDRI